MMKNEIDLKQFNDLEQNFKCMVQEASELIQAITKIQIFGLQSVNPDNGVSNLTQFQQELSDFQAMFVIFLENNPEIIDDAVMSKMIERKLTRLEKYYVR